MTATNQLGGELLDIIRRDRLRRSRGKRFAAAIGKLFTALLTGFLTTLIGGWYFMLAVGVAHAEWVPALPTIGYWWAVLTCGLLRSALSLTNTAKSDGAS